MAKKYVYFFGAGKADGKAAMKNLLGGKGANLAEMAGHPKLKLPVPPGFTILLKSVPSTMKTNKSIRRNSRDRLTLQWRKLRR